MKWSVERKLNVVGLGLALLLTGFNSIISYQNSIKLIESADKVKHTHEVLKNLTNVLVLLTDAESSWQGYILVGDKQELKRYNSDLQSINLNLVWLRQLIADNYNQQQKLEILSSLIAQKVALFKSADFYQSGKLAVTDQASLASQSKKNRDEIRKVIAQMQSKEGQLLKMWLEESAANFRYRMLIEFFDTFLTFGILFGLYALLYRQMVKRQQAENNHRNLAQEKELSDLKIRFFSMVSHEFRTPLTIILSSAQLLAESSQQWTEEKKLKNLHRIQSSAKLMTQLLTDILTLTRAEAGKLECKPEIVDLESFCLNLVEDIQFGSETEHSIKFVSIGQCTHAKLDEKLLYSIISNLLSNALKYSPQGSNIDVILNCSAEAVIFEIKDEGIGIPKESQQELYEPFHRCKNVGDIVGTGLGLSVVKKCLDLHRGQISVKSEVGVGTTFTVKIPLLTLPR